MSAFDLPLSVTDGTSRTQLVLELPAALPWAEIADAVCAAAGVPPGTTMWCDGRAVAAGALVGVPPLLCGARLTTRPPAAALSAPVGGPLVVSCVAGPDAGRSWPVLHDPVVIGRGDEADLVIGDPHLSLRHARVTMTMAGPQLTDLGSVNGLAVNGAQPARADTLLPDGAVMRLGASRFTVRMAAEQPLPRTPDGRGHLVVSRPPAVRVAVPVELAPDPGAPPARPRRPLPILAAVLAALVGGGLALLTGQLLFLLIAAAGPATMIGSALGDRWSGRRSHGRALAEHGAATAARAASERALVDRLRRDEWDRYPDPATCVSRSVLPSVRLWERRPIDREFGAVVVGVGNRDVRVGAAGPFRVDEVPVMVRLRPGAVLGVAGPAADGVARSIVLQMATLHAPGDLTVDGPADLVPTELPHADRGRLPSALRMVVVPDAHLDPRSCDRAMNTGVSTCLVCTAPTLGQLPDRCTAVLTWEATRATLIDAGSAEPVEPTAVARDVLDSAARGLAALTDRAPSPDEYWAREPIHPPEDRAAGAATAMLGTGAAGPVVLDLERDGPHVLVAGTTGSGKSELLITLIAGLAAAAPPSATSFVLVDYKGGAAFAAVARLPHVTALVTDLDPALAARGLTSLRAELRRRERFLAAAGAADLAALRRIGRADLPPRLVIVMDEFATVATEVPQFLTGLLDVAQRGRSLGLHLVLATQRPAGVVSAAIRANMATRICLRVVDETESRDVLDLPDAAALPTDHPGMALLRRGRESPVLFRSSLSTAPTRSTARVRRAGEPPSPGSGPSRLDTLIKVISAAAPVRPPAPWLPPLPARLLLADPHRLGLLDLPDEQQQRPWDVPAEPLLAVGAPGSGRTGLLRRWAAAQAADGAELLLIDAGTGLTALAEWPATSTRLDLAEPCLVLRLLARLSEEIDRRAGVPGPPIALAVDGLEPLAAVLDQVDFGNWTGMVTKIAERGRECGVRLAIAGGMRTRHHRCAASFRTVAVFDGSAGPGRARLPDGGPEVQVAIADEHVSAAPAPRPNRLVVRPLPSRLRRSQLTGPADQSGDGTVLIGLGGDDAGPIGWQLGSTRALLVAGPPASGVTSALRTLAQGAAAGGIPVLWVVHGPAEYRHERAATEPDAGAEPLRRRLAAHEGPLLLVCDRAGELEDQGLLHLLGRFCASAGPGQILALGARLDHALSGLRGPIPTVASHRTGLLLSAEGPDGRLLGAVLPRRSGAVPPGRGHLFTAGVALPVQVALSE